MAVYVNVNQTVVGTIGINDFYNQFYLKFINKTTITSPPELH